MTELEEVNKLISLATYPNVIQVLKDYASSLEKEESNDRTTSEQNSPSVDQDGGVMDIEDVDNDNDKQQSFQTSKEEKKVALKQDVKVAAPIAMKDRVVYTPVTDFAWDQNGYDSPIVTVYVDLTGVGTVKDRVSCDFTNSSFDLKVMDLNGKNYRLIKDNLDKDIVPDKSKILVKKNKVVIKLQKVKGQYSYESWTNLTSKKSAEKRNQTNKDPSAGIMDMMKDMYDEGDDNMRRIIGEAMLKSKSGEKMDTPPMPSMDGL